MKNLKSFRPATIVATAIVLFVTSCSKEKSALDNDSAAKITTQLSGVDPTDQKFGAVKGYVAPANAKAAITLINLFDGSRYSTISDNTGFFDLEKVPAGVYTIDVVPNIPGYGAIQFDVIVSVGLTTVLNITLPKK